MWIIRFILLGMLVALEGVAAYLSKYRSRYERLVESTVFNIVLVIVWNCVFYLIVILPPDGGWNARPVWMQHTGARIGFPVIGLLLICAGAFLGIATLKQRKVIGMQNVKEGLLTSGTYRHFRHPINTAILWITLGLALLIRNPDGLLMFPAILTFMFVGTILEERRGVCMRFREQYHDYRQTTRMFGPIWIWGALVLLLTVLIGAGIAVE